MSIIIPSDFKGDRTIAQVEELGVQENVQYFIDKYEPIFLKALLGVNLYQLYAAGVLIEPIAPEWASLRSDKEIKSALVNYVYYWIMRDKATKTVGVGESLPNLENATSVSGVDKQISAWNDMVDFTRDFKLSPITYPSYIMVNWRHTKYWHEHCGISEIYFYKNSLDI